MESLISVIIPTHNRAALLKKAIQSVIKQTFQHIEIIIIDDASTDNTNNVLSELSLLDPRITVITNRQSLGGSKSRNIGISASKGKWIAFLDDDDEWLPEKLHTQLTTLSYYPNAIACSSGYVINYPFKIKRTVFTPSQISHHLLLKSNLLGGASVCLCSANMLKKIGGFDETLKSSQDWDVWLRLRNNGEIVSVLKPLVHYHVHFNYRISNNMRHKYLGSRRFYFKHRTLMNKKTREINLSFICYIKSRQNNRSFFYRIKYLFISIKYNNFKSGLAYLLSSVPRLII